MDQKDNIVGFQPAKRAPAIGRVALTDHFCQWTGRDEGATGLLQSYALDNENVGIVLLDGEQKPVPVCVTDFYIVG